MVYFMENPMENPFKVDDFGATQNIRKPPNMIYDVYIMGFFL